MNILTRAKEVKNNPGSLTLADLVTKQRVWRGGLGVLGVRCVLFGWGVRGGHALKAREPIGAYLHPI